MEIIQINKEFFKKEVKKEESRKRTVKNHPFISIIRRGSTIILSRYLIEYLGVKEGKYVLVFLKKANELDKGEILLSFVDGSELSEEILSSENLYSLKNYSKSDDNNDWRILNTKLNNFIFNFFDLKNHNIEKKSFKIDVLLEPEEINGYKCYKLIEPKI